MVIDEKQEISKYETKSSHQFVMVLCPGGLSYQNNVTDKTMPTNAHATLIKALSCRIQSQFCFAAIFNFRIMLHLMPLT